MKFYTVTWSINLWADSPEEAALEAQRIQRDPTSLATYFTVKDGDNKVTQVDTSCLKEALKLEALDSSDTLLSTGVWPNQP